MRGAGAIPTAAYIHVPFCRHRCGYCNFTLVARRDDLIESYIKAIQVELASLKHPRTVDSLFFGGGTPTHLSVDQLQRLVTAVREWFPLNHHAEFSVEANPTDITTEKATVLAELGVTRISLGVQSFADSKLELLERDHRADTITRCVQICQKHFRSVACDLIFGAPGETRTDWQRDINQLVALQPQHISTYGLTIEKGTSFWGRHQRNEFITVDEETDRAMYLDTIDRLATAGFEHYEISNFSLPNHRCQHNLVYWRGEPYYAAGPGAASYVNGVRRMNHRSTTTYLNRILSGQSPVAEVETLDDRERALERLVFALRMIEGVDRRQFQQACGWDIDDLIGHDLTQLAAHGMLDVSPNRIRLTREGIVVSDAVFAQLLG